MGMLKYALFTGCTVYGATPELLKSTMAVAEKLGIDLQILKEATCCGASHLQDFDDGLATVLNARTLCYAEAKGLEIVTICNTCQLNLARVADKLNNDEEARAKVNEKLAEVGLKYHGTVRVRHFLYALRDDFGYDKIAELVEKPLKDFNIAAFYGCHNIRPSKLHEEATRGENPYVPTSLDELIKALGANAVDYESKNKCCGFHVELQAPKTANALSGNAISDAADQGADFMVTPCPLCQMRMDIGQKHAAKTIGRELNLPVLHMPQMVGLALGIEPRKLGLYHNIVEPKFV
ncbi:MAG: CoB--CoM heterodisulfide reductase iron-sulfur subunit B family protein [Campylobacterales bacterium]